MTDTELVLFKEIIRDTVKTAIKEEREAMKKDLKDIKLLMAGILKENRNRPAAGEYVSSPAAAFAPNKVPLSEEKKQRLAEMIGSDFPKPVSAKVKALMSLPQIQQAPAAIQDVLLETASQIYSGQDMNGMQDALPGEIITE